MDVYSVMQNGIPKRVVLTKVDLYDLFNGRCCRED